MKRIITIILLIVVGKLSFSQTDSLVVDIVYKTFKYPNGDIASEGYLKDNKPTGFWKSYYITGVKKSEGKWTNNKLDSIWIFYDQLGDTTEKINYYQGKKNGYYYRYQKSDQYKNKISIKELYVNGKRNDKSCYYYENGNIKKVIPYNDDKRHGIGFEYNNYGSIITITRYRNNEIIVQENINRYNKDGRKDGLWKYFYNNGILRKERSYLNGKLNGYVKLYNENGKLVNAIKYVNGEIDLLSNDFELEIEIKEEYDENNNIIFQGSFKKEIPIGIHRFFDNSGNVSKSKSYNINGNLISEGIVLKDGREDGEWKYYYVNGKKKTDGKYKKGKKTGKWIYYYPNGNVQQTGSYSNDKLTGIWQWYYETGELLIEEFYIYGQQDGESIEYSVLGEIISKGNYIEGYKEGEWLYVIGDQKYNGKYIMDLKDGLWRSYYLEEEKLSFEGRFLQENPDGKHKYYYPDGKLKEEQYYSEGEKVKSWSKYNEHGDLVLVVQYKEGIPYKINGVKIKFESNKN